MKTKLLSLFLPTLLMWLHSHSALAQIQPPSMSCDATGAQRLDETPPITNPRVITAYLREPIGLNYPNLWWAREQFDNFASKLVNNWFIYPQQKQIDLVVNRQVWLVLNYIEHYRFVNQFGTVARAYGYNLRVFNQQRQCLATYSCDFVTNPPQCKIDLRSSGNERFQL